MSHGLPPLPVFIAGSTRLTVLLTDGSLSEHPLAEALPETLEAEAGDGLLCAHARSLEARLRRPLPGPAFDVLDLFAFVLPGRLAVPSPAGLAQALSLPAPQGPGGEALTLLDAAQLLLETLADLPDEQDPTDAVALAEAMSRGGWAWGPSVLQTLAAAGRKKRKTDPFALWRRVPEWQPDPPAAPAAARAVAPKATRDRLALLVASGATAPEPRPGQVRYAETVTQAFTLADRPTDPVLVVAEAGTGTGKTLGYLAPASLWAEANDEPVWVSTFTRSLQHQIGDAAARLPARPEPAKPQPEDRRWRAVLRKGRENYLCLLNYQEATQQMAGLPRMAPALGLVARWLGVTQEGDLNGRDLPPWLAELTSRSTGREGLLALADRRGDCLFSACPHWSRCFVEHAARRARRADIVIANHALALTWLSLQAHEPEEERSARRGPQRFVFDEGHHLFEAADSAFARHLTARETADLRRWILGSERARKPGAAGLARRLEGVPDPAELPEPEGGSTGHVPSGAELVALGEALHALAQAAAALPGEGWPARIEEQRPLGPIEALLSAMREQVLARSPVDDGFGLEVAPWPLTPGLAAAITPAAEALAALQAPVAALQRGLEQVLIRGGEHLEGDLRRRIQVLIRMLEYRLAAPVAEWRAMLQSLAATADLPAEAEMLHVDWLGLERGPQGRLMEVGLHRHHTDPMRVLWPILQRTAKGVVVTSATLGGARPLPEDPIARLKSGAGHSQGTVVFSREPSPFAYDRQALVILVPDVLRGEAAALAGAMRALFLASGGGALGLFTAIRRLRQVWERIAPPLAAAGLPLFAQHVDGMEVPTLVELFRATPGACLLGTDAMRDGIDVPGAQLRLLVADRVPWPRPTLLHRVRRAQFGGRDWDDHITGLRLRQAFGRLIRRADDQGVFVLLDRLPSRLHAAFPEGTPIVTLPLEQAVAVVAERLQPLGPG